MSYEVENTIKCNQGSIRAVRFNVDGDYILTCGADRTVRLWNWQQGTSLSTYKGHAGEVFDARGSCDSAQIVTASSDKNVTLFDVATGKITRRWRCHNAAVTAVQFNEESTMIISGSQDNTVKLYDVRSKAQKETQSLDEPTDTVTSIAITNDTICVGSADTWIRNYDIRNGKLMEDCMGEAVTCVAISRDRASHLAAVADGTCKLIDGSTGQLLACYKDFSKQEYHDYKIEACFNYSDSCVIVGSPLGDVVIYDLIKESVLEKKPLGLPVSSLGPHPLSDIVAASAGGSVTILKATEA